MAVLVGVATAVAIVAIVIPNRTPSQPAAGRGPAPTYTPPKEIHVTPKLHRQLDATLAAFVHTPLPRPDLTRAYGLVTSSMLRFVS